MTNLKRILPAAILMLTACTSSTPETAFPHFVPQYEENTVVLQNLKTRTLVYCYNAEEVSAEECAAKFEKDGFVRLRDIPKLTAEYDFLKADTYPTRRWRKNEKIPRW